MTRNSSRLCVRWLALFTCGAAACAGLALAAPSAPASAAVEDAWDPLESTCRHASLSIL